MGRYNHSSLLDATTMVSNQSGYEPLNLVNSDNYDATGIVKKYCNGKRMHMEMLHR